MDLSTCAYYMEEGSLGQEEGSLGQEEGDLLDYRIGLSFASRGSLEEEEEEEMEQEEEALEEEREGRKRSGTSFVCSNLGSSSGGCLANTPSPMMKLPLHPASDFDTMLLIFF